MKRLVLTLAAVLALCAAPSQAHAVFTFTLTETATAVTILGTGTLNTSGLTLDGGSTTAAARIIPSSGYLTAGAFTNLPGYTITTTAAAFGTGNASIFATTSTGDGVGIYGTPKRLYLFSGYVSGNPLSNVSTYNGATFASLGFTPGTYTYTLPSGDSLVVTSVAAAPEPSTWALLGVGAGLLGVVTLRQRLRANPFVA